MDEFRRKVEETKTAAAPPPPCAPPPPPPPPPPMSMPPPPPPPMALTTNLQTIKLKTVSTLNHADGDSNAIEEIGNYLGLPAANSKGPQVQNGTYIYCTPAWPRIQYEWCASNFLWGTGKTSAEVEKFRGSMRVLSNSAFSKGIVIIRDVGVRRNAIHPRASCVRESRGLSYSKAQGWTAGGPCTFFFIWLAHSEESKVLIKYISYTRSKYYVRTFRVNS